ncbi:MAG: hypothetical protein QNK11_09340 [Legionella sp.]|nr:hypothetical protein [Legionella sp.]
MISKNKPKNTNLKPPKLAYVAPTLEIKPLKQQIKSGDVGAGESQGAMDSAS